MLSVEVSEVQSASVALNQSHGTGANRRCSVIVVTLATLTAIVLVSIAGSLQPVPATSGELSDTRAVAVGFYRAANQAVLSDDAVSLANFMDAAAQISDGTGGGRLSVEQLANQLGTIGAGYPNARLEVTSLTTDGAEAVALVRLTGADDRLTAAAVEGTGGWIDRLMIRDGVVTALSGGTAMLQPAASVFDGPVLHTGSTATVGLVTITIESGAPIPVVSPGALAIVVEDGTVHIAFQEESAPIVAHYHDVPGIKASARQSIVLQSGEGVAVFERAAFILSSKLAPGATVKMVALLGPSQMEPATAPMQQHGRFSTFLVNSATGSIWAGPAGGTASMDSRLELETNPGIKRLRIDRLVLGHEASLMPALRGSNDGQVVIFASMGRIVTETVDQPPGFEANSVLLEGPGGFVVPRALLRVEQLGVRDAELFIVRLDDLNGG